MSTPINTRDLRLQATTPRLLVVGTNYINLTATSSQFKYGTNNVAQPTQSVVTATPVGALNGQTVTFTYSGLTTSPTAVNNTVTILPDNITGDFATITATLNFLGSTYTSSVSISKIYNQLASRIQRPIDLITSANDGTGYTLPSSANYLELYNGTTKITTGVTYSPATTTKNGLTVAVNTTTGQITVSQASANAWTTDSENFTLTAIRDTVSYNSTYTITKAKAGNDGSTGVNARVVNLTTTQQAFVYDGNGANPTGTAIVTATTQNTSGTVYYEFLKNNISQTNTTTNTYSYSPQSTYNSMPDIIEVRIRETTNSSTVLASDVLSLYGIKPGVPGISAISGFLTNEAAVVAADNSGTVSSFAGTGGTFKVYDGITDKTGIANYSVVTAATVGVSITIDTAGIYTITAMSADTGYATLRAVYAGVTIDKVYSIAKSKTGTGISGASTYRIYIAAASSSATVTTPGTTQNGTTPSGWSTTPVALTGTQAQFQSDGKTPADDTTTTWSTPYLSYFKVDTLEAITANTGNLTVSGTFKAGSANINGTSMANGTAGGVLYNTGNFAFGNSTTNITFNGTVLTLNGNIVGRDNIANSAINNDKILDNTITGAKIVANSITADKITGGTITSTDSNFAINIGNYSSWNESGFGTGYASTGISITRNQSNFPTIDTTSLTQGYIYQIVNVGTTNWQTVGGIYGTPSAGRYFIATGNAGSGTGTVKRVLSSAINIIDDATWPDYPSLISANPALNISTEYSQALKIMCFAGANSFTTDVIAASIQGGTKHTLSLASGSATRAQQSTLYVNNTSTSYPAKAAEFLNGSSSISTITVENRSGTSSPAITAYGIIQATGNVIAYYSDDRLKTKLGFIRNALEKLTSLSGFYYEPNEAAQKLGYEKRREVGVSAQEVQKILPEIIHSAPINDKYLTVDYERLIPLIIEAIKELDRRTK